MNLIPIFKSGNSVDSFISRASVIGVMLLLSNCAFTPYNTQFECPTGKGSPCTRLSTINQLIDRGELGSEEDSLPKGLMCRTGTCKQPQLKETHVTYFPEKALKTIKIDENLASLEEEEGSDMPTEEPVVEQEVTTEEFQA